MTALAKLKEFQSEAIQWRRHLHANPETAFEEVKTSDYVAGLLQGWGIAVHRGLAKTGVVGVIEGTRGAGKTIGLRADMDALNILEETNTPYCSTVAGKMHACGHDGHTATLLLAARALAATRDFAGRVVLIFQPAEEDGGGGEVMVNEGLFDQFNCDAVFGLHNWPYLPEGVFAITTGAMTASADEFKVRITGKGGHAAFPHTTVDPVLVAAHIVTTLQHLVSRMADPAEMAVVSVTRMDAGTESLNVIPATAMLGGTIRTTSPALRAKLEARLRQTVQSIAQNFGATAEIEWESGYPSVVNTPVETALTQQVATTLVGEDKVLPFVATMGAEDFAYMLQKRPGAYIALGAGKGDDTPGLHHPKYDFNDDILPLGAAYWVRLADAFLNG